MADAVLDRLEELVARVAGIERRLGAVEQALDWRLKPRPVAETRVVAPPPLPSLSPPPLRARVEVAGLELADVAVAAAQVRATKKPVKVERTLEAMIGRNWTSWVGAIVVVLGVFFFLKYAWEQGWLAV
jgi:uncharacterized membrane protein